MNSLLAKLSDQDKKRFSTLQSLAALHGISLAIADADDGALMYYCHRWALSRCFANLDEVGLWLANVIGRVPE